MTIRKILLLSAVAAFPLSASLGSFEAQAFFQESDQSSTPPSTSTDTPEVETEDTQNFLDREGLAETLGVAVDDPQLAELTDDQVIALNRSMNGWSNNAFDMDLPEGLLARILEDGLNAQQIRLVLKGAQEEAKFNTLADRMAEKAEQTGNPKMLEQADKLRQQGSSQKEKFEGMVENFDDTDEQDVNDALNEDADADADADDDTDDDADDGEKADKGSRNSPDAANKADKGKAMAASAKGKARQSAKLNAKSAAKNSAKGNAKSAAKRSAKASAKAAAKAAAKDAAKKAAKENAKENAKKAAKSRGRG